MALDLEAFLARMADTVQDADATLEIAIGGLTETTRVRLWRGQVLVDWEPDDEAGDCLLRPDLVRRLATLGASAEASARGLRVRANSRVVARLSHRHAAFVAQVAAPAALRMDLYFDGDQGVYLGGSETYAVSGSDASLLTLRASVERRPPRGTSEQTAPGSG